MQENSHCEMPENIAIFQLSPKGLALGYTQVNLVFRPLNRTFVLRRRYCRSEILKLTWYFARLIVPLYHNTYNMVRKILFPLLLTALVACTEHGEFERRLADTIM